jgi:hypothetical protein
MHRSRFPTPRSLQTLIRHARAGVHRWQARGSRRRRAVRFGSVLAGAVFTATLAFAATNWTVSLNGGSSAEGQSASVAALTIAAVSSPAPSNLLYPGGYGDVVLTITNPNSVPVAVTGVTLPSATTYATGYTNSTLTTINASCTSSTSLVAWAYAATPGVHNFTSTLIVGANSSLTVTFTNDAFMGTSAPAACENTYFSMPSLSAITATAGAGTATGSPATDAWTS